MASGSESKPPRADDYGAHFRALCIIARHEMNAHVDLDWASVKEIVKSAAARARLDYSAVEDAMAHVKASTHYRGPNGVHRTPPRRTAKATIERKNIGEFIQAGTNSTDRYKSPQKFSSLNSILSELQRRGLTGEPK